jgi:hypothetical protein
VDPEWGKNPDRGSGMNIPDHFSESLEKVLGVKNTQTYFDAVRDRIFLALDPGWKNSDPI